jgi:hypothetical protein
MAAFLVVASRSLVEVHRTFRGRILSASDINALMMVAGSTKRRYVYQTTRCFNLKTETSVRLADYTVLQPEDRNVGTSTRLHGAAT